MNNKHPFFIEEATWLGEGKIAFSASPDIIRFFTKWQIPAPQIKVEGHPCLQVVEMLGDREQIENNLRFYDLKSHEFKVDLDNQLIGTVQGTGFFDELKIAWEFRGHPNFEGFEIYELQENGDYIFHAEYVSPDQFRSIIDGRIWKKAST